FPAAVREAIHQRSDVPPVRCAPWVIDEPLRRDRLPVTTLDAVAFFYINYFH
ncbi:hypothetical protein JYU34_015782, partial [Plutella xylostella]